MVKKHQDLGTAKHGTGPWWHQRMTAIALAVLLLYLLSAFITHVVFGGYDDAIDWLRSPFSATLLILFLIAAFYHAALGLQVVIEDYVHCEGLKLASILAAQFISIAFATLGVLSVVKILFWSLMPHDAPPNE